MDLVELIKEHSELIKTDTNNARVAEIEALVLKELETLYAKNKF